MSGNDVWATSIICLAIVACVFIVTAGTYMWCRFKLQHGASNG